MKIKTLTSDACVCDGHPKVDSLLGAQLLVVPLLLDTDGAVRLNCHPRVLVPDLERFLLSLLLQRKHAPALLFAIGLGKLYPFRRSHGPCHPALVHAVVGSIVISTKVLHEHVVIEHDEVVLYPDGRRPFGDAGWFAQVVRVYRQLALKVLAGPEYVVGHE